MTFLKAAQSAAIRLGVKRPTSVFSSEGRFEQELVDLSNDVLTEIIKAHDWRDLILQYKMVGDGVTRSFDLPADYDRMPKNTHVRRMNWYTWGYVDCPDLNFWNDLTNGLTSPFPGYWIMLGGTMQFIPSIAADTTAEFYYVSSAAVIDGTTSAKKSEFTKDTDTFVLDEKLLTLGLIWRWRQMKQLNYAEDMKNYEIRLEQLSSEDKGARIVRMGHRVVDHDSQWAYPKNLGI